MLYYSVQNLNVFNSPLEQFTVLPILPLRFGALDFSIDTIVLIAALILFLFEIFARALLVESKDGKEFNGKVSIIPNRWQALVYLLQKLVMSVLLGNVKNEKAQYFFPMVFLFFVFILSMNMIGLVPYSFTITSNFFVTLFLSLSIFIGINIICIRLHKIEFFSLFLPPGTSLALSFLLVPIELISYIFKPISLAIRLFANMMAGHALLAVIAGFAFSLMSIPGLMSLAGIVPLAVIVVLYVLELAVAFIQTFVFTILICIYINDALNLH